jgi:hypothetical protein
MRPYEHHDAKPRDREPGDSSDEDVFLDRMSGLLDAIVRECASIGRTEDASAVLAKATNAFEGVQRMCREAGIVHADAGDERVQSTKNHSARIMPLRSHDIKRTHNRSPPRQELRMKAPRQLDLTLDDASSDAQLSENGSQSPSTPLRSRLPLSSGEDIIQVEITDILTSTQEEIHKWKHEFRLQMLDQEAAHHDQHRAHMEQIQTLNEALSESQRHISKLARTIQDTNEKLETMQSLTTKAQKAMEVTLKEHTQYWKAICHDLVMEKRAIATKLAEERGKNHSLREHLDMHDSGDKVDAEPRSASPPSSYHAKTKRSGSTLNTTKKEGAGRPHISVYGQGAHRSDFHENRDNAASPPRASFRRYYLSKS